MKLFRVLLYLSLTTIAVPVPAAAQHVEAQAAAVEKALAQVAPSLVRIHVVTVDHVEGRELKREASGSGTIITPNRAMLGSAHSQP